MPGRTRDAARAAFLAPLRQALSCVTTAQLFTSHRQRVADEDEAITLSEDPLRLRSATIGDVTLQLRHQYRIVKDEQAPRSRLWKVRTIAYFYQLDDSLGREIVAWHWHPATGNAHAHVHVSGGRLGKQAHLPTGRVSIESVLRLLLTDMQVLPAKGHARDYEQILAKAEKDFIEHRSWHA